MKGPIHVMGAGVVVAIGTLASCAGDPPPVAGFPQSPDGASIAQSFAVGETRRGTRDGRQPQSTLVDYESELQFRPDRIGLARAIGIAGDVNPELRQARVKELDDEIASLEKDRVAVQSLSLLVDDIAEYHSQSLTFHAKDLAADAMWQDDPDWRGMTEKRQGIIKVLNYLAAAYVDWRDFDGKLDQLGARVPQGGPGMPEFDTFAATPEGKVVIAKLEQARDETSRIYNLMAPPKPPSAPPGFVRQFVAVEVTRLLNETTEMLTTRLQRLGDAVLAKAPDATLEMEANLVRGEERLPVTISPYTIVDGVGRGSKSPRVGVPSKQDMDKVQQSYQSYAELSKAINELQALVKDREKLAELKHKLVTAIETAARNLEEGMQQRLQAIVAADKAVPDPILDAAKKVKDDFESLQKVWKLFTAGASSSDPITLASSVASLVEQLRERTMLDNIAQLAEALNTIPAGTDGAIKTLLEDTKVQLQKEQGALIDVLKDVPGVGGLASAFTALQAAARIQGFGNLKPGRITSNPIDLRIAEVGVVDLNQTAAESGDRLEVTYRLTKNPNSSADQQRTYTGHSSLDVRKFGYYTTLKSQIVFYDRLHDGLSTYSAAPGISYNLHYRPECAQDFFDVLAPGVGVSVSAPNFDGGTELAVGGHVTLFNDMLQMGYAYNISVETNNEMFFFGLDLISVFQGFQ